MERGEPTATGRRRYSVAEAAEILGTSVEGVRGRIKRGTLDSVKDDGAVYVLLPTDQSTDRARPVDDQASDQSRPDAGGELVDELRDRIAFLERQLQGREEELRRRDAILMNMTEVMKAIGPPGPGPEAHASSREAAPQSPESPGPTSTPPDAGEGPETAAERPEERQSWWRRFFGLE